MRITPLPAPGGLKRGHPPRRWRLAALSAALALGSGAAYWHSAGEPAASTLARLDAALRRAVAKAEAEVALAAAGHAVDGERR